MLTKCYQTLYETPSNAIKNGAKNFYTAKKRSFLFHAETPLLQPPGLLGAISTIQ